MGRGVKEREIHESVKIGGFFRRIGQTLKPYLDSFEAKIPIIITVMVVIEICLLLYLAYLERDFFVDLYDSIKVQSPYRPTYENEELEDWWRK